MFNCIPRILNMGIITPPLENINFCGDSLSNKIIIIILKVMFILQLHALNLLLDLGFPDI